MNSNQIMVPFSLKTGSMKRLLRLLPIVLVLLLGSCIDTYIANPDDEDEDEDSNTEINSSDFSLSSVEALKENTVTHESSSDYSWTGATLVKLTLDGKSVTIDGEGASVSGGIISITSAGNYSFSGSLSDGQVVVNTSDTAIVRLILNNAELSCSSGSAVSIEKAAKTMIVASEGTSNQIIETAVADSVTAAVYSKSDLTFYGNGKLSVSSVKNDGIISNDGAILTMNSLSVSSGDDAIVGKDYVVVKSGSITVDAGGDGIKSNNSTDATKGYVALITGTVNITSDGDALSASTDAIIVDGNLTAVTGDSGSSSGSAKGIKGLVNVIVESGTIDLTCADNAIHSKGNIAVNGGSLTINTTADGNDGIKSGSLLTISGGTMNITVEGNQSKALKADEKMTLNGGDITIKANGDVLLEASGSGYEVSYCTGIKSNGDLIIDGSTINITCSGIAGKGVSTDGNFSIASGYLKVNTTGNGSTYKNSSGTTDSYGSTCISTDGTLSLLGGTVVLSSSGSAGKGISSTGEIIIGSESATPDISITTTGSKITVSGSTSSGGGGFGGGGAGGGSTANYASAKAMKSDAAITINSGTLVIASSDDGIKSEKSVTINNGSVSITKSTEGIESPNITINDGVVSLVASDDGFNATAGLVAGGSESNDGSMLTIKGGTVAVSATGGDAIDSNGSFSMSGGTVVAQGPSSSPELGMDVNGTIAVSGGLLIASGPNSGNMIEAPSTSSSQYSIKVTSSSIGTNLVNVRDADGNDLFTFKPARSAYYVVFSSPALKNGSSHSIYTGGSATGTAMNGYYSAGAYSGGTLKKTFTVSGKVTSVSF